MSVIVMHAVMCCPNACLSRCNLQTLNRRCTSHWCKESSPQQIKKLYHCYHASIVLLTSGGLEETVSLRVQRNLILQHHVLCMKMECCQLIVTCIYLLSSAYVLLLFHMLQTINQLVNSIGGIKEFTLFTLRLSS